MPEWENTAERIGVLLVHGMGEQRRYDHLRSEVEALVNAMRQSRNFKAVSVEIVDGESDLPGANSASWASGGHAPPVRVLTEDKVGLLQIFEFREVWWADLDEPMGIFGFPLFCWRALGLWGAAGKGRKSFFASRDNARFMRLPRFPDPKKPDRKPKSAPDRDGVDLRAADRCAIFFVALLAIALALPGRAFGWLFRRIGGPEVPIFATLFNYLNDVLMMSRPKRSGGGTLVDRGEPIRVAVRRRTVRAICQTALAGYSRWYVLAHSLGTVVAHNGLNELAHTLPNYVNGDLRRQLAANGFAGPQRPTDDLADTASMTPARPVGVATNFVVYRDKLFSQFKGLLTYGSPLDKFAAIWPMVVAVTDDEKQLRVFEPEWINAWSPQDPVSAELNAFDFAVSFNFAENQPGNTSRRAFRPKNVQVQIGPAFLVDHIRYLEDSWGAPTMLAHSTVTWMATGKAFAYAPVPYAPPVVATIRSVGWIQTASFATLFSVFAFSGAWYAWRDCDFGEAISMGALATLLVVALATTVSIVAGIVRWRLER